MSSYGPPGGYGPGGPPQGPGGPPPGSGGQYGDPADPWGGQPTDPWGGQPSSVPPGYPTSPPGYPPAGYPPPQYGYEQPPPEYAWQQQPPPPPKGRRTALIVGLAILLVLLGAGAATAYVLTRDTTPQTQPSTQPSAGASQPEGGPVSPAQGSPGATASDARFAVVGQCVVNDGTNTKPQMRIVPCASGAYEVLGRFDGTIDFDKNCPTVQGYQYHFYYDATLDVLDFVLCMRKR